MKTLKKPLVFLLILCFLLSSLLIFTSFQNDLNPNTASALSVNTMIRVQIVNDNDGSDKASADYEGIVSLRIEAIDDIPEDVQVSVYYRTIDATAVSGVDYTAVPTVYKTSKDVAGTDVSGKVVLTKGQEKKGVEIYTNYVSHAVSIDGTKNDPYFDVEIYKVENASVTSKSSVSCYLNVESWMIAKKTDTTKGGNGYVFEEYLNGGSCNSGNSGVMDTDPSDQQYPDWFVIPKMSDSDKSSKWTNDFINTGIASPYITFTCHVKGGGNGNEHFYISDDFGEPTTKLYESYNEPWVKFNSTKVHINRDEKSLSWDEDVVFSGITYEKLFGLIDRAYKEYYVDKTIKIDGKSAFKGTKAPDLSSLNVEDFVKKTSYARDCQAIPDSLYNGFYTEGFEGGAYVHYFDNDWVPFDYANNVQSTKEIYSGLTEGAVMFWYNFGEEYDLAVSDFADAVEWLVYYYYYITTISQFALTKDNLSSASCFPTSCKLISEAGWLTGGLQRMYFKMDSLDVCIRVFQDSDYEREVTNFNTYFILDDQIAPKLKKDTDIKVNDLNYNDNGKDKTRITLQFSEPVWVSNGDNLWIEGNANNNSKYPVVFKYAGGSGSDVLFFDLDKSELDYGDINITGVQLTKINSKNGSFISDFSRYSENKVDFNCVKGKNVKLNYDLRTPTLTSLSCDTKDVYCDTQNINVRFKDVSNDGFIQYVWKKPDQPAPLIDEYVNSTKISGTVKTIKSSDGESEVSKNGEWRLYVRIISALGKWNNGSCGYIDVKLDNETPVIGYIGGFEVSNNGTIDGEEVQNNNTVHSFKFYAQDEFTRISQIKFLYSTRPFTNIENFSGTSLTVYDDFADDSENIRAKFFSSVGEKQGANSMLCNFQVDYRNVDVAVGSKTFYIGVVVYDEAGNQSKAYVYDKTVVFSGVDTLKMSSSVSVPDEISTLFSEFKDVFVINKGGSIDCFIDTEIGSATINSNHVHLGSVIYANSIDETGHTSCIDVSAKCGFSCKDSDGQISAKVTFPQEEGCYDFYVSATFEHNNVVQTLNSAPMRVYVYGGNPTTNSSENLKNLKNKNGFISKAYMLSTEAKFFYLPETTNSACAGALTESYCGYTDKPTIFSSEDKAKEYIRFMEMQDVSLLKITSANYSSVKQQFGYRLADTNEVKEGEYWIRYKSKNWFPTTNNTDWEYYYYGIGDGTINWSRLSGTNLDNAISAITSRIVEYYGSAVYIHEDYYNIDGTLDSYGTPCFLPSQLHDENLKITKSKCGTPFFVSLDYSADIAIYDNHITSSDYSGYWMLYGYSFVMDYGIPPSVNDKEALRMDTIRRIFYTDDTVEGSALKQLLPTNGVYNLKDLPESTCLYTIYELSEKGFCQYNILLDRDAPTVDISYVKNEVEDKITLQIDQHDGYYIFAQYLSLNNLVDKLDADFAYISLFKRNYASMIYYGTYLPGELDGTVQLEEGNYVMQISDRSGNTFSVSIFVNNHDLKCTTKIIENKYIQFNVLDRTAQEIDTYEVYRNGKLIPSTFMESQLFYDSGEYTFRVKDQYGNPVWEDTVLFERTIPQVSLRYLKDGEEDVYIVYNSKGNDLPMFVEKGDSDANYSVYTRTKLRFTYDVNSGYEFAFSGNFGHYEAGVSSSGLMTITLTRVADCRLKIWYTKYPTNFVYYNIFTDVSAPIISLSTDIGTYMFEDLEQINQNFYRFDVGSTLNADSVKPILNKDEDGNIISNKAYISNKATVFSDLILGNIEDSSPLKRAVLYINGRVVTEYVLNTDVVKPNKISDINITQPIDGVILYGTYRLEVEDIIGNTSIIEFYNNSPDTFKVYTDDVLNANYGNKEFKVSVDNNCDIYFTVTYGDNKPVYKILSYMSGGIYESKFVVTGEENKKNLELQNSNRLFEIIPNSLSNQIKNANGDIITRKKWYPLNIDGIEDIEIYFDLGKTVMLRIPSNDDYKVKVCMRIEMSGNSLIAPLYSECVLSTKMSNIILNTIDDDTVVTNNEEKIIYVKDSFYIEPLQDFDEIELIEVGRSAEGVEYGLNYETMKITTLKDVQKKFDMTVVYKSGVSLKPIQFVDNVHYLVHIRNIYGIDTYYYISKSEDFELDVKAIYEDRTSNTYTRDYAKENTVYSNSVIELYAYANGFSSVSITKIEGNNRITYSIDDPKKNGMTEKGYYYVYLDRTNNTGVYEVCFIDIYGHTYTRKIEIGSQDILLNKAEIIDFNYTDSELSNMSSIKKNDCTFKNANLNPNAITEDIVYIAVKFGNESPTVLYDVLSASNNIPWNLNNFVGIFGDYGDGEYNIEFRNKFGDCYIKTIRYQSNPTISVIRQTRLVQEEEISFDDLIKYGIWTNASYTVTGSQGAILEKNGSRLQLPFMDEYTSSASEGKVEYSLHYYDEFGFNFEINVHIVRSSISLDFADDMNIIKISNLDTTTDDVSVVFKESDGVTCTYSYEGGEYTDYYSGTKLQKDGTYSFIVSDRAGNVSTKIIRRDTYVEYSFVNQNLNRKVISGELVNDIIYFSSPATDTSYIKIALLNGVAQEDTSLNRISEDGKWEFIIADAVGNQSYFCFYKHSHEINKIKYNTPYGYKVTSASHMVNNTTLPVSVPFSPEQNCSNVEFEEDGYYEMTMTNSSGEMFTFHFTISTILPTATLVGCEDNGLSLKEVSLDGLSYGDQVFVYKNGELVSTYSILTLSDKVVMSDAGEYKVVIRNIAGNEISYNFTKKLVMNTAGSVLIIVLNLILAIALFVGILYRTKNKIDK